MKHQQTKFVVVVGGGAAGFFAAINLAEKHPDYRVIILEKSPKLLEKVRISGGGRCNVTHACFEPQSLIKNYPRGERELLSPFLKFHARNTIEWFRKRGVEIKKENDGRMFPVTDSSETIIDCLLHSAKKAGVEIITLEGAESLIPQADGKWKIATNRKRELLADAVVVATGSAAKMWHALEQVGHTIIPPVPSLFTFNIKDKRIVDLAGVSVQHARVRVKGLKLETEGALLITHWGMSGPCILRLSAWGARQLHEQQHRFVIEVDFTGMGLNEALQHLEKFKQNNPQKRIENHAMFDIPERLWRKLLPEILAQKKWAECGNKELNKIAESLCRAVFQVEGKSANKDEFVTAGGVLLKEVDFKTMQSKKHPNLFFAGEALDIDAITGGFNFQAAWTTAWIVSESV